MQNIEREEMVIYEASFVCFFSFSNHLVKADKLNTYIKATKNHVPLFDNSIGSLVEVGYMEKGDMLKVYKDQGKNWWQIKFGNSYAYVYKGNVESFKAKEIRGENTSHFKNSNDTILLMENQRIYDNSTGKLVPFVTIKGNMRYPIIRKLKKIGIKLMLAAGLVHPSFKSQLGSWSSCVNVPPYFEKIRK
ncbi:SH3 domain-containing protein [Parageobacillus thermoglucosidasius]|uniref:SH3 domain-containing protein n=1 Tax=Parageobacillus thermoglucosidasius TaxID=1426 RepID=UPI001E592FAD|nr:SH3 domain-containing protein [Parageobacillus thermoglucosidasius]